MINIIYAFATFLLGTAFTVGAFYVLTNWRLKNIETNVSTIMENHLPHINESIGKMGERIARIEGSINGDGK